MASDVKVYRFECVNPYHPEDYGHGKSYILMEPGDTLEVDPSSMDIANRENPKGWLKGRNVSRNSEGLFPAGPYVHFVQKDFNDSGYEGTPHRPPRIPHRFVDSYRVRPHLCMHCNDYVWGKSNQGKICEACGKSCHAACAPLIASTTHCSRSRNGRLDNSAGTDLPVQ
ncbi:serine/threonine-protein kinase D1, partial [Aplysia californica]|uniref:Serine/threonine-protein kinase D1 n=1 Tax=Aplysia californica TaxID=6500 RepID=A0ABM1A3A2_APLCA